MVRSRAILCSALTVVLLSAPLVWAGENPVVEPQASKRPESSLVRQESLELPGLTACHQCEWRPKPHSMDAAEQCGITPDGTANVGIFECGFSPQCDRVCEFVRCAN